MCFSVTASYTAGAVLIGMGGVTLGLVRDRRELAYAAIPLLFGVQQISEGLVWSFSGSDQVWLAVLASTVFSVFSHVIWPAYIPIATWLMEPRPQRRRALGAITVVGGLVALYLLYSMIVVPITARISGGHVEYLSPHYYAAMTMTGYLLATAVCLMVSSLRWVRVFGLLAGLSFAFAYAVYSTWFISVWCFFAALMSVVVLAHFLPERQLERVS